MNPLLHEIGSDARGLAAGAWRVLREKKLWLFVFACAVAAAGLAIFPRDVGIHHRLTDQRVESVRMFAQYTSKYGDYTTGTLIISIGLWIAGAVFGRRAWRTAALACLLAASCAGLLIAPARALTGRPRPNTDLPDAFTGPSLSKKYTSFPSGHAGTAFATATALAVAAPAVGGPALAGAALVGWSRMYTREHHLTDVIVGASIGVVFGMAFGAAARNRRNLQGLEGVASALRADEESGS